MQGLQNILFGASALCALGFVLLLGAYWRNERKERRRQQQTRTDIADMAMLFQTMRDILGQQKAMARGFNEEMQRKMGLVKQVLAQGVERNQRLYERQKELEARLDEATAALESLQRQIGHARTLAGRDRLRMPGANIAGRPAARDPEPSPPRPAPAAPPAQAVFKPETAPPAAAWTPADLDFDALAPPAAPPEEAPPPPVAPAESAAARQAFRSLLNLEAAPPAPAPPPVAPRAATSPPAEAAATAPAAPPAAAQAALAASGNGSDAVRARVIEYGHAGMPVAEIARELGIGKGEVRLYLSLAKQPPA